MERADRAAEFVRPTGRPGPASSGGRVVVLVEEDHPAPRQERLQSVSGAFLEESLNVNIRPSSGVS